MGVDPESQRNQEMPALRPFPGLRFFTREEAHLFFGREGHCNQIVRRLEQYGLAAIVGTSGCGKSSLVRAGLMPALDAGYAAKAGAKWRMAELRPGSDPLGNLAVALDLAGLSVLRDSDLLRTSSAALVKGVTQARQEGLLEPGENLLILADQFEELFRFDAREVDPASEQEEKAQFVAVLLESVRRREQRIFVVMTLRAEYLGDCAQFRDLSDAINRGLFLVPRLTRLERRAAIEGPVRVAGARIASRLVDRLLNELGEDPDQLPLLQHALMRTWGAWLERGEPGTEIDFVDYDAIGALGEALDRHADETFEEACRLLGEKGPTLVRRVFQRLRGSDDLGRETRRPTPLRELCAVSEGTLEEVRAAVDCFRDDEAGETFLTPFKSEAARLGENREIDVTHESLLRCWSLLAGEWVSEEEESARIYIRLAQRAEDEEENPLRGGLLQTTLEWWLDRKPNAEWARRYPPAFEEAERFLFWSLEQRRAKEREERDRAYQQARQEALLTQTKVKVRLLYSVIVLSLLALALLVSGFVSVTAERKQAQAARSAATRHLLASRAALAADDTGSKLQTALLLAAEALKREPTLEAQTVVSKALSLLPPPLAPPVASAREVAIGAEGSLLAALSTEGVLHLSDLATAAPRPGAQAIAGINSFALARESAVLATLGRQGEVVIRDLRAETGTARFACPGTTRAIATSASGTVVAAVCGGTVRAWKAAPTWGKAKEIRVPRYPTAKFAPDDQGLVGLALDDLGRQVALNRKDVIGNSVLLIDLGTGLTQELGLIEQVTALALVPAQGIPALGNALVVGDDQGSVRLWLLPDVAQWRQAKTLTTPPRRIYRHSAGVTALALSESGREIIVGHSDGLGDLWSLWDGQEVARLAADVPVASAAVARGVGKAILVGTDFTVRAWNLSGIYRTFKINASGARFAGSSSFLLHSGVRGVGVFDVAGRRESWQTSARTGDLVPVEVAPDRGSMAVVISHPRVLDLRSFSAGRLGASLWPRPVGVDSMVRSVRFSPDGKHLAGFDGLFPFSFVVWNAATGERERYVPLAYSRRSAALFEFTPDSRHIVITSDAGELVDIVLPGSDAKDVPKLPEVSVKALAFSPDGRLLAIAAPEASAGSTNGGRHLPDTIHLHSYPSGRLMASFNPGGSTTRLAFSPDSRFLLSANPPVGTIHVWDPRQQQEKAEMARLEMTARLLAVTFSSYNEIAVVQRDALIFPLWQPADLRREACRRIRHNLTPQEWKSNMPGEPYPDPKTCPELP